MKLLHVARIRTLFVIAGFAAVTNLAGCGGGVPIRASEQLTKVNQMQSVAVLGSSRIVWPRMGGKEAVIGLRASRQTLEAVTPLL